MTKHQFYKSIIILILAIFSIETVIMIFLNQISLPGLRPIFINSLILILILYPILHFLAFRPMMQQVNKRKHAEETLSTAYMELNQIFQTAADGMCIIDKDFNILRVNETFSTLAGVDKNDTIRKKCYEVIRNQLCHTPECPLIQIVNGNERVECDVDVECDIEKKRINGMKIPCIVTATPFKTPSGELVGIVEDFKDISDRKQAEETLKRYQLLFNNARDIILFINMDGQIIEANNAAVETYGYQREELLSLKIQNLRVQKTHSVIPQIEQLNSKGILFESIHRRKDGTTFPVEISSQGSTIGQKQIFLNIIRDISERKKADETINYMAFHDSLTDLPNRTLFYKRLKLEMEHAQQKNQMLAVMFMDLDHFKYINDTFGHDIGDELLKKVAQRLKGCIRKSDTVARLGGDEFTLILTGISNLECASSKAEKISIAIKKPFILKNNIIKISASIGIALYPEDAKDAETLMKYADDAMYEAKKEIGTYKFYCYRNSG